MKLNFLYKSFILLNLSGMYLGCQSNQDQDEVVKKFASVYQTEWTGISRKHHFVNLSMRNIDSLSAELNIGFTSRNALGL